MPLRVHLRLYMCIGSAVSFDHSIVFCTLSQNIRRKTNPLYLDFIEHTTSWSIRVAMFPQEQNAVTNALLRYVLINKNHKPMFKILMLLTAGIAVGYLLSNTTLPHKVEKGIQITIYTMLFVFGTSIGASHDMEEVCLRWEQSLPKWDREASWGSEIYALDPVPISCLLKLLVHIPRQRARVL